VAHAVGYLNPMPAPISTQVASILADAAKDHLEPVYEREIDLQGTGSTSKLVLLRPELLSPNAESRSDEIRLYQADGQRLHLVYAARPLPVGGEIGYEIKLLSVGSFDKTDRQEALFSLYAKYADEREPRPVALLWNDARQTYELQALLPHRATLIGPQGDWARGVVDRIYPPVTVSLAGGGAIHSVGAAQGLMFARSRLAAGYEVRKTCNACSGTWQFKSYCLNFRGVPELGYEAPEPSAVPHLADLPASGKGAGRYLVAALHRGFCE
jgi:hypothetical protein